MAKTLLVPVKDLSLDLHNFRTVPQKNEVDAVKAMISISPDHFWALMESLLDDGYLPTENILAIEDKSGGKHVKEGNRRVASLKIILGVIDAKPLDLPQQLIERIATLAPQWIQENSSVPCTLYKLSDADLVDRIITRTHGKGTKAGRDDWETVARARHNRDKNGASEVALDLLEKYLATGTNLTEEQRARWAGKYVLSVLDEAIKKTAQRFGAATSPELVRLYPLIPHRKCLDEMIYAIGMETLTFTAIRDSPDLALRFGVPAPASAAGTTTNSRQGTQAGGSNSSGANTGNSSGGTNASATKPSSQTNASGGGPSNSGGAGGGAAGANGGTSSGGKTAATATNDERTVRRSLRALTLFGQNRSKLVTLRQEALKLKIKDNPIAFCFLLRSMFEISAKAYCDDHATVAGAPTARKADGTDRNLADVLKDIITHLTQNKKDTQMVRVLHGPGTEILRHEGILSITSMNQLVHSPTFTIQAGDIPTLFANIFPLLDHMNK
ncbi:hypothetical protein [Herbaspirillum sp. ST 5-3]|uniref:hypothetical protein n=1 Tax=Oxalobacteraceae TaxID=75682 RepID=UPI0010A40FFD|nr:hypothetical protein [Herbaspirillum sp. ST 5-3]